jgi:mono/diheme cytochrome c family protein
MMIRRTFAFSGFILFCALLAVGVSAAQKGKAGDAAKGKETFESQNCAMCHNVDNPEKKMGPSLQGLFKRKVLQNGKPVNDANVLTQIKEGGNGMPPYPDDQVSAEEKANLLAYLHTL